MIAVESSPLPGGLKEDFGRLVAEAAARECGQLAINHAAIAGCRFDGSITSRCNVVGMDRVGGYDCSGLSRVATLAALYASGWEVAEPSTYSPAWRHVRQLAVLAEQDFLLDDLAPGTHMMFERQYDIGGRRTTVAGHMGIIVGRRADGNFSLVQTVQSRSLVAKSIWRPEKPGAINQPWGIVPPQRLAQVLLAGSA